MPNYNSTARVPFKTGGSVKKPKIRRIILGRWGPKAGKPWPGATKAREEFRKKYGKADGGRIELKKGGGVSESQKKQSKEHQKKIKATTKKVLKGVASMYNPLTAAENIKSLGKKAIEKIKKHKKKIKKGLKIASYGLPQTWGYHAGELGKKFRDKKAKGGKAKDSVHQPTTHSWWLLNRNKRDKKAKGGKADKNWIQGVNKSIKKRGTKGVCTGKKFGSASCKPGSKRYNLAKTFKKMARSKHASGGLVRYI